MDEKRSKVAVVGAGSWGYQHARAFSAREDAFLCSITGRTAGRTQRRADAFDVPAYLSIEEMLARERPDLVAMCMPGQGTFAPAMQVLRAGVPLLVEKPLAYELPEARAMVEEAERQGTFFAINFNHRYSIPAQMAQQDMARLGEVIFAHWRFGHGSGPTLSHPFLNLIEAQCHGIDLLWHLCGPIESVMAEMTDRTGKGSFSTFALALRFAGGGVGNFLGTFDASENYENSQFVEIQGTKARLTMEDSVRKYTFQALDSRTTEVWNPAFFRDDERSFNHNLDRHLSALLPALRAGHKPPVPATCGLRALEVAYAAIESFKTGRRVRLSDAVMRL